MPANKFLRNGASIKPASSLLRLRLAGAVLHLPLLLAGGCVPFKGEPPSQLDVAVENSPRASIKPDAERRSRALYHYLAGEIAYDKENYDDALESFKKSSRYLDEPAPELHSKLAELYLKKGQLSEALKESQAALQVNAVDVNLLLLHAGILEALERHDDAARVYEQVARQEPGMMEPYILLSGLYLKQREFDKSIAVLNRYVASAPKEAVGQYSLGKAYEAKGDFIAAHRAYKLAYALDDFNSKIAVDVVRALLLQKRTVEARDECQAALERDPANITLRKVLGQLLLGESRYDEALAQLQLIEKEEGGVDTRFKIALIHLEKQNLPEATRELNLLLASNPDHAQARYYLASIYASSGRNKDALAELFKIESAPDKETYIRARTYAAFILRQDGDLKRAEAAVRDVLKEEPTSLTGLSYLVLILRDQKRLDEAREVLHDAIEKDPSNDKLLFSYGLVLHDIDDRAGSLSAMEKAIAANPENADARNFVAYDLADRGVELERAFTLIQEALKSKPNDGFYLDTLGWIYFKKGEITKAEEKLAKAVALAGDDVEIMEHYGDVLVIQKKLDHAREVYSRSYEKARSSRDEAERQIADRIKAKLDKLPPKPSTLPIAPPQ